MASASPGTISIVNEIHSLFNAQRTDRDVLERLRSSRRELEFLISSRDLSDDTCACLVHLINRSTSCEMPSMRQGVLDLLNIFCDSPIFDKRGADLLLRKHDTKHHGYHCLLSDYISVLEKINLMMPASMVSAQMIGFITLLQNQVEGTDLFETKESMQLQVNDLHINLMIKLADKAKAQKADRNRRELPEDKWKPPEDFRQLPVIPVENDLIYETLFLRKNKTIGKYSNLDHYLDVQFRLYKEDCVVPLREAYAEFIIKDKNNRNFRIDSGRIYRDVKILNGTSTSVEHGEVFIVEISSEHRKRIKWNNSRRLTFGSLLIMSFDRFHSTFFAVVADSDPVRLQNEGLFKVKIYRTRQNQPIPRETPGIILEATSAYFEAYYHVLLALQSIRDFMPFEQYIVKCNKHIDLPKYLGKDPEVRYDLTPTITGMAIWRGSHNLRRRFNVEIANSQGWPNKECLKMDESQRQAFISALTKEFVLIQGPPGTGKTYLGLQIAKALLHNVDAWKVVESEERWQNRRLHRRPKVKKPCLLVVCYTNDALDQFVEGIIKFLPRDKIDSYRHEIPDVIRIGSRCNNEMVEKYNIKNFRYLIENRVEKQRVLEDAEKARTNVLSIRAALKAIQSRRMVVSLDNMKRVMAEKHAKMFGDDMWMDWLHASMKCWSEGAQKKASCRPKTKKQSKTEENDMAEIIIETEYEINERSLDDDTNFQFDETLLGVNVDKQLSKMVKALHDVTYQELLIKEAEQTLDELREGPMADDNMMKNTQYVRKINVKNRWKMYRYWLHLYINMLQKTLQTEEEYFNRIFDNYKRVKAEIDEVILNETSVIAVTTTAAAKYHDSLMKIGPQITIIEEAAEVPEAHIVTAINPDCEHLILIGDHKQLEPKLAVQKLAVKYNLSTSLFERMINNGLHYKCLQRQHRMRPEISNLVRHMYPVLEDNENVLEYEEVKGISHNLFFVSHEFPEHFNEDGKSFSNEHEAKYIKQLCIYLLNQGYHGSDISVITAYKGQMFLLRTKMPRDEFLDVNICVLDNYQGEENEIIILSLVRSNKYGDIGFLRKENRICVALSRAKKGLYIIGNSKTLEMKTAEWKTVIGKIKATFIDGEEVCLLGNSLPLYCQNHPETKIMAKMPSDFEKAPEGGCDQKCQQRLKCDHVCRLFCHPYDKDHKEYNCRNTCHKRCPGDHVCNKSCHYPKPCNCFVMVNRTLKCGHSTKLQCYLDPNKYECQIKVKHKLECGHDVILECHMDFTKHKCKTIVSGSRQCGHDFKRKCFDVKYEDREYCKVDVNKTLPNCHLQHTNNFPCYLDISDETCKRPVQKTQDCGHTCILACYQWEQPISPCTDKCESACQNGHICQRKCHFPTPCNCKVKMDKILPGCGHEARLECHEDEKDYKDCCVEVNLIIDLCGHSISVPCKTRNEIEKEESQYVRRFLEKMLKCQKPVIVKHPVCGHEVTVECWQKVEIKLSHALKLGETLLGKKCMKNVQFQLKCSHSGSYRCWEKIAYQNKNEIDCLEGDATIKCSKIVPLDLKCGHTVEVECWKQHKYNFNFGDLLDSRLMMKLNIKCKSVVYVELKCGHVKAVCCWRYTADAWNTKCNNKVSVELPACGHALRIKCCKKETFDFLAAKCTYNVLYKYEECGHFVYIKCYESQQYMHANLTGDREVIPPCKVELSRRLRCGHSTIAICSSEEKIECSKGCEQKLLCGHSCSGACKICQENSSHMECQMVCAQNSFCGHNCESKTCMKCLPCYKKCNHWCPHTVCSHKCTKPCQPCSQPCSWECEHFKCTKLCSEPCDRPRCDKECDKILPCGHKCSGFCGEPCPKSCIDCNASLVMQEKVDSKYCSVTLVECNHSFDYNFLDQHMEKNKYKLLSNCPQCEGTIRFHPRYNQILKNQKRYAEKVKRILNQRNLLTVSFPIIDESDVLRFHKYVGKFMTFLQITKFAERNKEKLAELEKLQSKGKQLYGRIEQSSKAHLQTWVDIANEVESIHLLWMAELIQRNEKLRGLQYFYKKECQTSIFYPRELVRVEGKEIASEFQKFQGPVEKDRWKAFLAKIRHYCTDIPQAMDGMAYPELTSVIGTHSGDWLICPEDHLTPSLLGGECITCSTKNKNDDWLERFNPILPKFQMSTGRNDRNRQQKGKNTRENEDDGSAQGRNLPKANKQEQYDDGPQRNRRGRGKGGRGRGRGRNQSNVYQNGPYDSNQMFDDGVVRQKNKLSLEPQNFLESFFVQPHYNIQGEHQGHYRGGLPEQRERQHGRHQEQNDGFFRCRESPTRGVGRGGQRGTANYGFNFRGYVTRRDDREQRGYMRPQNIRYTAFDRAANVGFDLENVVDVGRGSNRGRGSGRNSRRGYYRGRRGGY